MDILLVEKNEEKIHLNLRRKYLTVFLLASFVDWLQGPYLYRVYTSYGYTKIDISFFYITGFVSSAVFGIVVGNIADRFGRKKLCLVYFVSTALSCLSTISQNHFILITGRSFGGISSAILYSTFESWYVGQHVSYYNLNKALIGSTFTKSTLYNGIIAIISGFISSFLSDKFQLGPTAPFLFSIPISIVSLFLCFILWEESNLKIPKVKLSQGLNIILFSKNKKLLIDLVIIQTIFETVMYIFVFLWTPILEPIDPSYGLIFAGFMTAISLGGFCQSILEKKFKFSRENTLNCSIILALLSIISSTVGICLQSQTNFLKFGTNIALVSFFFFEFSVGLYYPSVSYIRGIIVPESYRASVVTWLRVPSNLLICTLLFYIGVGVPDNLLIFEISTVGLVIASIYSIEFAKYFAKNQNSSTNHLQI